jgi:hypothetical protein
MKVLYYITSHGYGHALRSAAICNRLSPETDIVFRTAVPRKFFDEEVKRPFFCEPAEFDCGCIQTDGVTVDEEKTLSRYRELAAHNSRMLDKEACWCARNRVSVIVSDIVPFAFEVASRAGVPSVAATNFTWCSIYEEYAWAVPEFSRELDGMRRQYSMASLLLAMFPANPMPYFANRKDVDAVGRVGTNVRERLLKEAGAGPNRKLGLIYAGNFGMDSVRWRALAEFQDWEFFGLYPLKDAPANYHCISKNSFRYQDCIASADVMIGKLGYGTCAECFINGLPIIYLPREGFAEYPVLHAAVTGWGHGYFLPRDDFYDLRWGGALDAAARRGRPAPMKSDGAEICAREIEAAAKKGS